MAECQTSYVPTWQHVISFDKAGRTVKYEFRMCSMYLEESLCLLEDFYSLGLFTMLIFFLVKYDL